MKLIDVKIYSVSLSLLVFFSFLTFFLFWWKACKLKINSYHYKTNPNSLKRAINNVLIGGQSGMFALRCEFHAVKSPIWENDTWEVSISDMSTVFLHHRTNDQKLLRIIHRNKIFFPADLTLKLGCVLYTSAYYMRRNTVVLRTVTVQAGLLFQQQR